MNLRRLRRKTFSCQADAQRAILEYAKKHHFADCEALCVHQEIQYKKKERSTQDTPFSVNYSIRGEFVVLAQKMVQYDPTPLGKITKNVANRFPPDPSHASASNFL